MQIDLKDIPTRDAQHFLQSSIAPRPIRFASTIDAKGNVNLSPFSFFNLFSSNPPVVIFSPSRRVLNGTIKHTLENVMEVPEVVINIVDYSMAQQMSLASCEYPADVNEFVKAGFTEQAATLVRPPMVAESKVKMECRVLEIKSLGDKGGAGNLVIAEVIRMHIADEILDEDGKIDQLKLRLIARLGGDWYVDASPANLFKIAKPNLSLGIGVDALPEPIRKSRVLTGNHLGQLANVSELPKVNDSFKEMIDKNRGDSEDKIHQQAALLLEDGKVTEAWQLLLHYY